MSLGLGGVRPNGGGYGNSPRRQQSFSPGGGGSASSGTPRAPHYTGGPAQAMPTTREALLEEKSIFLANELASRDAALERLERENLNQMREVSRIRREMQQKRDEEVNLMSAELREASRQMKLLRDKQDAEVARRVRDELQKHGIAIPKPVSGVPPTGGRASAAAAPLGANSHRFKAVGTAVAAAVHKIPHATKPAIQTKSGEKMQGPARIPLGVTPKPKSNARKQGDNETVRGKKKSGAGGKKYKGLGPHCAGEATALFDDGLAYRVEDGDNWHFYNDTPDYELHLNWEFGPQSRIQTCGDASSTQNGEGWTVVNCVVYPDETKPFVTGSINGWKSAYSLKPLSDAYRAKLTASADASIMKELRVVEQLCAENGVDTSDDNAVLELCKQKRVMFVDLNFRPNNRSVSRPGQDESLPVVPWQRPMQYLPAKLKETICLFNGIDPNDIDQGSLGDCWFLCAIASIAEFPDLVRAIFSPSGASDMPGQKAAYKVRLNKHGWFHDTIVDSYFPTTGGRPCFAQTCETPGELWVALLEKAYAKLHGSYAAISGGYPLHAMIDLTGFAGMNITPRMEEARTNPAVAQTLFDDMVEWDSKDFMISVGTPGVDESDYNVGASGSTDADMAAKYKKMGLVNGHAYSVLQVKSFPAHGLKLLQIRNPWGNSKEWSGEWGDDDQRWKQMPDVADACSYTNADDGTFWMPYKKFLEYFEDGQVIVRTKCRMDSRVKGYFARGVPSTVLKISVKVPVDVMLTLSQKDPRGLADSDPDKKKQAMLLTLARGEAGGKLNNKLCSGVNPFKPSEERMFRYDRDQSMFVTLEPTGDGTAHYILPRIYDDDLARKDYTLAVRVPPGAAHRGDIKVEFVTFGKNASPFQNYATYSEADCDIRSVQTDCQTLNRDTLNLKENKRQSGLDVTWQQLFEGTAAPTKAVVAATAAAPAAPAINNFFNDGTSSQGGYGGQEVETTAGANKYFDPSAMMHQQQQNQGGPGGLFGIVSKIPGFGGATQQGRGPSGMDQLVGRIDRFYNYYEPSKAGAHSVQVARKYLNQQDLLFSRLTEKYGPEPEDDFNEDEEFFDEEEDDDSWF